MCEEKKDEKEKRDEDEVKPPEVEIDVWNGFGDDLLSIKGYRAPRVKKIRPPGNIKRRDDVI